MTTPQGSLFPSPGRWCIQTDYPALPMLFYDFNSPPDDDGLYTALVLGDWELRLGQRVIFGCEADDVMAEGEIAAFVPGCLQLVRVRLTVWRDDITESTNDS